MGPTSVVKQADGQVSADLDGEVAMMSIEHGEYYVLDAVGSRTWELIEKPIAVSELCARLVEEYDVGAEECARDVLAFLDQMMAKGLIEVETG
jgi:hypothetical protein